MTTGRFSLQALRQARYFPSSESFWRFKGGRTFFGLCGSQFRFLPYWQWFSAVVWLCHKTYVDFSRVFYFSPHSRFAAVWHFFIMKVLSSDDRDRMLAYRDLAALDKLRSMSKQGVSPYCEYSGRWRKRWKRAAIWLSCSVMTASTVMFAYRN